jgi:hypothetical protein
MSNSRLELHEELLQFIPNAYFQPPSNVMMKYPCIVYNKTNRTRQFSGNQLYMVKQGYQLMVITKDPDSLIAEQMEQHFQSCVISQNYTVDNLHHTTLNLYY